MDKEKIPEFLKPYFWDVEFEKLDIKKDKLYIVSRLYSQGNIKAVRWVENVYSPDDIREVAIRSRNLTPLCANYLRQQHNLKKEDMAYYRWISTT